MVLSNPTLISTWFTSIHYSVHTTRIKTTCREV